MIRRLLLMISMLIYQQASANEVLIASGHAEYPPFMYRQGDNIIGVGADLTKIIFAELGISVKSIYAGAWNRVQRKAESGEIDLVVGIYKNPIRQAYLSYPSEAYVDEPVTLFINKDNPFIFEHWHDLIGKKGGTLMGESFGQEFDEYAQKNLNIQRLASIGQNFKMLNRHRLHYTIYAYYPGLLKALESGLQNKIIAVKKPLVTVPAYQAISKKSKFIIHLPYFNQRIIELKADGTINTLIDKHMLFLGSQRH